MVYLFTSSLAPSNISKESQSNGINDKGLLKLTYSLDLTLDGL